MKYELGTDRGDVIVTASSERDARSQTEAKGYRVHSARPYYGSSNDTHDSSDNIGSVSVDLNGGVGFGIGGGLVIESDGDLGIQIAPGISIDI